MHRSVLTVLVVQVTTLRELSTERNSEEASGARSDCRFRIAMVLSF